MASDAREQEIAVAEPLPIKSNETSIDRLLEPSSRQEQINYAVRETLARQAQEDAQAHALGARSVTDKSGAPPVDILRPLTLSNVYHNGAKELPLDDDINARIGRLSEPLSAVSQQLFFEHRQERAFDHIADSVFPGFGRFEFKLLKRDMRFDYLNGRRCNAQKLGLCFSTTGR
jgi:hypothetical protein